MTAFECWCEPKGSFSDRSCYACREPYFQRFKALGFSTRAANLLANLRCENVKEFFEKFNSDDVLAQPNMGPHTVNEFEEYARKHDISWGNKPLRLVAYGGGQAHEVYYSHWSQVGGKIGNLVGDVESLAVFENGRRVLFYHVDGIH